jgi:hypothetical protein
MDERAVSLNKYAPGIRPLAQGVGWFEGLADAEQFEVLRNLAGFCIQARASSEDGRRAPAELASGRPTPRPCWSHADTSPSN